MAKSEEAIIAGVDAKSASLDSIGALVQVHRYTYCADLSLCGAGGTPSTGGKSSSSDTGKTSYAASVTLSSGTARRQGGHLDLALSTLDKGGASGGGAPSVGAGMVEVVTYTPFCSGSLVGPTAVLTAKHCLRAVDEAGKIEVGFAIGPDAYHPKAVYPVVDWDWESEVLEDPTQWLSDLGSDVGVAHLGASVTGAAPLAIGTLSQSDVGKRFNAVGFGIQDNKLARGTRKAGSITYRGTGGNYADYAFGGLSGFLKIAPTMPQFTGFTPSDLTEIYGLMGLLPEYQAFFGGKKGDAQPCNGDSGGPIVASRNGVLTIFGGVTNGFASSKIPCDYGVVASIFGPLTQAYIEDSLQWVDSCEGVTVQGQCDGDLAIRCTDRSEGERRLSETDCALIGQTCGVDETGTVACVDPAP